MLSLLLHRLQMSVVTLPNPLQWWITLFLLGQLALLALLVGRRNGFLRFEPVNLPLPRALRLAFLSFLTPALTEEIVFRVLPLPRADESCTPLECCILVLVSLIVFIAYHPLRVLIRPSRRATTPFLDPVFLQLTALVGCTCTNAYLITGSVWPPVLLHGTYVVVWLFFFGGYRRMGGR